MSEPPAGGLLLVDKPSGPTSHDVVSQVRRLAATRKVGHAGTLDPMATGLLILGIGRATRLLTYLVGAPKSYTATIRLGQESTTDDAEGQITESAGATALSPAAIEAALAPLRGEIWQVPSAVSAIKVDGQRAYARVRAGEQVQLAAREVSITAFDVLAGQERRSADGTPVHDLEVAVRCSSGTYIRALARDLGRALGTGGHLRRLRRTAVGPYEVASAHTLEQLEQVGAPAAMMSITAALHTGFASREVSSEQAAAVRHGRRIATAGGMAEGEVAAVFAPDGRGLALVHDDGQSAKPVLVLDPA